MTIERAADNVARASCSSASCSSEGWQTEWRGEVTGVIGAGAFVAFDGYEGLLPVRRLRGDWWELDELETMLVGRRVRPARSGSATRVTVQVEKVDAPRGRVDLSPVELRTHSPFSQ